MTLIDRLFRFEDIGREHLHRWTLLRLREGRALYLHHYIGSDERTLHDHPKRFVSIGLWGGYVEEAAGDWASYVTGCSDATYKRQYRAPWIRSFEPNHTHRLRIPPSGCWTLCYVGPWRRHWGFVEPGRWTHWRNYWR